mgnify:CR=1 FL=1
MTEKEYKEHIQYTHNAYCWIVIRHASIDAARMLYTKWKREISLEYLSEEKFMPFSTADEYFSQPPMNEDYPFAACGQIVLISDPALAALSMLPQQKQEEIFLYYFRRCMQKEIGKQYGHTRSTTGRHIQLALRQLWQEMEVLNNTVNIWKHMCVWVIYFQKSSKLETTEVSSYENKQ